MIIELVSVLAMFVGGCALVRTVGIRGWGLPALGYLTGAALLVGIGFLQLLTPLSSTPALTLALTAGLPVVWWAVRLWQGRDVGVSVRYAALGLAAVTGAVLVSRQSHLVNYHYDSFRYLMTGAMIANNSYEIAISPNLLTKRLLGVPLLHAPAHLAGEYHLRSVFPLMAVATLAALVWFLRQGLRRTSPGVVTTFAVLGVLLLLSTNRFVFNAFYLNGHLILAALTLIVVGCGWLLATSDHLPVPALVTLQLVAIPAMVVTRVEAPLLVALAVLPTVLSPRVPTGSRSAILGALGGSLVLWNGFMAYLHGARNTGVPISTSGMLLLGVAILLTIPLLWWRFLTRRSVLLLLVVEAGLWLALLAAAARRPAILRNSVRATAQNVVFGSGSWGASLLILAALVVVVLVLLRAPQQTFLRFPVTTFAPLMLLTAYLRGKAFRVGDHDSLNRMLIQIVPVAVLYLVAAMAAGDRRFRGTTRAAATTRAGGDDAPAGTAGLATAPQQG